MMDGRDQLDTLLDRALSEYSQASPRTGLEQRILANLDAQASNRPISSWQWTAIAALTMFVICAVMVASHFRHEQTDNVVAQRQQNTPAIMTQPPIPKTSVQFPTSHRLRMQPSRHTPRLPEPRLTTFPSSSGDDDLVRLAVSFVQAHPAVASQITQEQKEFRQLAEAFTAPLIPNHEQQ